MIAKTPWLGTTRRYGALSILVLMLTRSAGMELRYDFYQTDGTRPISITFQGQLHDPSVLLSGTNYPVGDRTTPQALMDGFYGCLKNRDEVALGRSYAPGERTSSLAVSAQTVFENMALLAIVNYGSYTICVAEITANGRAGVGAKALRRIGADYYFTDALNEDRAYNFFRKWVSQSDLRKKISPYQAKPELNIRTNFFVFADQTQLPPLKFEFAGNHYNPPTNLLAYRGVAPTNQILSTPEGALAAAYAAAWQNDLAWYVSLVCTQELDSPFERMVGLTETVRANISNDLTRVSMVLSNARAVVLDRIIRYDQYAIAISTRDNNSPDWLVFKPEAGRWLITDELNRGSSVWAFLMERPHPNSLDYWPKVLPR